MAQEKNALEFLDTSSFCYTGRTAAGAEGATDVCRLPPCFKTDGSRPSDGQWGVAC